MSGRRRPLAYERIVNCFNESQNPCWSPLEVLSWVEAQGGLPTRDEYSHSSAPCSPMRAAVTCNASTWQQLSSQIATDVAVETFEAEVIAALDSSQRVMAKM